MNAFNLIFLIIMSILNLITTIQPKEVKETIDYLVLVNKQYKLPDDWESKINLINVTNYLREPQYHLIENTTYQYFTKLRETLIEEHNITIELDSVYRSAKRQQEIWDEFVRERGEEYAKKYVAAPGYSEHQTGLAVDICLKINGKIVDDNDEMIAQKEIFAKIHEKLEDYGFILRYLQGKEKITGYNYEPWHLRFVKIENAKKIKKQGVTLEEYLGKWHDNSGIILTNKCILILVLIICLLL